MCRLNSWAILMGPEHFVDRGMFFLLFGYLDFPRFCSHFFRFDNSLARNKKVHLVFHFISWRFPRKKSGIKVLFQIFKLALSPAYNPHNSRFIIKLLLVRENNDLYLSKMEITVQ